MFPDSLLGCVATLTEVKGNRTTRALPSKTWRPKDVATAGAETCGRDCKFVIG
jgi:hypothetical protein